MAGGSNACKTRICVYVCGFEVCNKRKRRLCLQRDQETRDHATTTTCSIIVSSPRELLSCVARKPTLSLAQPKIRISPISPPDRQSADHPCTARCAATPAATLIMTLSMWLRLLSSDESYQAPCLSLASYTSHTFNLHAGSKGLTEQRHSHYRLVGRYFQPQSAFTVHTLSITSTRPVGG